MNKQQINEKIKELEKEISNYKEELKKVEIEDFQKIIYKNKERIRKEKNKQEALRILKEQISKVEAQ